MDYAKVSYNYIVVFFIINNSIYMTKKMTVEKLNYLFLKKNQPKLKLIDTSYLFKQLEYYYPYSKDNKELITYT